MKNKKVLATFLSLVLGQEVVDLQFDNTAPRQHRSKVGGTTVRTDVLATLRTEHGLRLVNVEVQNVGSPWLTKRALYDVSRLYLDQFKNTDTHEQLRSAVAIFITDFCHLASGSHAVSRFRVVEASGGTSLVPLDGQIELVFLELPKVEEAVDSRAKTLTRLERWLLFLAARDDATLEALRGIAPHDPELEEALAEIEYAALSPTERRLYKARIGSL